MRVLISLLAGEAILLIELAMEMVNKEEKEGEERKVKGMNRGLHSITGKLAAFYAVGTPAQGAPSPGCA